MVMTKKSRFLGYVATCALFLTMAFAANAQHAVSFTDGIGIASDTVELQFAFENTGGDSVLEARARISDMSVFSNVDADNLCAAANGDYVQCGINDGNRIVIIVTNFGLTDAIDDFTGSISFVIDEAIDPATLPMTIDVEWDHADDAGETFTPSTAANGSIEIVETPPIPPEELSELSVAPASINFGTVDLGGMPVTDVVTAENTGGSASSLTISAVALSGDAEFSVVTDGCTGTDLAAGETCDVTVEFDAGADGVYTGSVDFTSDADTNPNASVSVTGEAGSAPDLSVTPGPGTINLGTGLQGDVLTSGGSFSNSGSAPGDVDCTVSGAEFSTVPSPIDGTIEPGGSLDFSVQCTLPADAEDGDTFGGVLACSGDIDASWELSCGVSEWEPLPVPTMQKWGLIVLTLMMLMVGGLSIRFFRG